MASVKGGLIQMSLKGDTTMSPAEIRDSYSISGVGFRIKTMNTTVAAMTEIDTQ